MRTAKTFAPALCLAALALSGCNANLFSSAPGHYEGFVAENDGKGTQQTLVKGDIVGSTVPSADPQDPETHILNIRVKAFQGDTTWAFEIQGSTPRNIILQGRELKRSGKQCFASNPKETSSQARLCFDGRELSIDLVESGRSFTLVIDRFDPTRVPEYEEPANYTIKQIVDHTVARNFNSLAEYQKVLQAKQNAASSFWAALTPTLSVNTFVGWAMRGSSALLQSVLDFVPFAFPDRWFRHAEMNAMAEAELDAWIVMRADAANMAEGLSYTIARDTSVLARYQSNIKSVTQIRDDIVTREQDHLLPAGSSDDITSIINALEQSVSVLSEAIQEEYATLAQQVAGFYNPKAISGITLDQAADFSRVENLDTRTITEVALQRSYELRQMDFLIKAARKNRLERYTSWIDPGAGGGISFQISPSIKGATAYIQQLAFQREGLKAAVIQKTSNAINETAQSIDAYRLAKQGADIQARRVERILANLRLGLNFSMSELVGALQDQVKNDVDQVDAQFAYLIATSKLNRLLFAQQYASLTADTPNGAESMPAKNPRP